MSILIPTALSNPHYTARFRNQALLTQDLKKYVQKMDDLVDVIAKATSVTFQHMWYEAMGAEDFASLKSMIPLDWFDTSKKDFKCCPEKIRMKHRTYLF